MGTNLDIKLNNFIHNFFFSKVKLSRLECDVHILETCTETDQAVPSCGNSHVHNK